MRKLLLTIAAVFCFVSFAGAEIQQVIETFTKQDYSWGAQNWQVSQQKNGVMYFANMNGLMSFDGIKWTHYDVPGCGNSLRAMHISQSGNIYVGGHNVFGVFKATDSELLPYESLSDKLQPEDSNFNEIWFINSIGDRVIFQSYEKLFVYENDKITVIPSGGKQMLYSTVINNTLFVATKYDGVFTLENNQLVPLPYTTEFLNKTVCSILNWNNRLIFVTQDNGIYIHEPWMSMRKLGTEVEDELIRNQAFCAKISGDKLAVGTVQNGVYVIDLKTGEYLNVNTKNGLQNNTVLSLEFDLDQDLWLGLNRGIDYINLNSPFKLLFDKNKSFGTGYCSLLSENMLYLGTNQGLFCTNYANGNIGEIESLNGTQGQVYKIIQIDNNVYCCHHNGLYEINGKVARKIVNVEGIWTLQRLQQNPNYLIAGYYNGLLLMKKQNGVWTLSHTIEGFKESSRLFEQDETGNIWVSHGLLGIFKIRLSEDLTKVEEARFYGTDKGFAHNEHISVFKIDNQIIFAAEDGIYKYNPKTDMMEMDAVLTNQLLGFGQYFFFAKQNNRLWFLKENTICYADRQSDGSYNCNPNKSFSIPEEILFEYFNLNVLDNSRVMVSNEDGFTMVDIDALDKVNIRDVYIRDVYSVKSGKHITSQYLKTNDNTNSNIKNIEIPFSCNSIGFEYCTVSYSDIKNKQTRYSVRLLGYENEWSEPSDETNKIYTDLSEGTYTFQVKTYNRNYESSISEFKFSILPPWYRTIWAYLCYAILVIFLFFLINRYIKHKEKCLEKENQKRLNQQKEVYEKEKIEKEKQLIELRNSQLENELKHKGNELASSTMNLVRKNEILIDIKEDIQKIITKEAETNEGKAIHKKLNKVVQSINENIEHDDDWMKFEKEFDAIHQDFIKRLSETYKGLTVNDKKLCAYLKMNLVSKDIAPLLNISVRGVEIGRYRLRKKLNLGRETNLTDFLQNF